jgi:hypothetical protein
MELIKMLPFLGSAEKKELVEAILNNELLEGNGSTIEIVPFLESEDISRLFQASLIGQIDENPSNFLPFLSDEEISKLIDQIKSGEQKNLTIEAVMPFLDFDQIKSLFNEVFDSLKKPKQE